MMNYFSPRSAAERYARGRLYFHPMIVGRIREFLSITKPLSSALDVGCGTGLSSLALRDITSNVTGVDASAEMIARTPRGSTVNFLVAFAENLPFGGRSFDLITLSQVIHWLDRDKFLAEAWRVLRPDGWLVIYDDYFAIGQMAENPEFQKWYKEKYLLKYPPPPRAEITFTEENTNGYGFKVVREERHKHIIGLSLEGLVDYLVSQSNIIAAVEGGKERVEEARGWLVEGIRPIFGNSKEKEFLFNAPIWYLHRTTSQRDTPNQDSGTFY